MTAVFANKKVRNMGNTVRKKAGHIVLKILIYLVLTEFVFVFVWLIVK